MSRKKSPLVSEHRKAHEILERLSWAVHDAGGDDEDLREALASGSFRERIGRMALAHNNLCFADREIEVMNTGLTEAALAQRLGFAHDFLPSLLVRRPSGPYRQTSVFVRVRTLMQEDDASRHLNALGYRFANIQEAFTVLHESKLMGEPPGPVELAGCRVDIEGRGPCRPCILRIDDGISIHLALEPVHPMSETAPRLRPTDNLIAVRLA